MLADVSTNTLSQYVNHLMHASRHKLCKLYLKNLIYTPVCLPTTVTFSEVNEPIFFQSASLVIKAKAVKFVDILFKLLV